MLNKSIIQRSLVGVTSSSQFSYPELIQRQENAFTHTALIVKMVVTIRNYFIY